MSLSGHCRKVATTPTRTCLIQQAMGTPRGHVCAQDRQTLQPELGSLQPDSHHSTPGSHLSSEAGALRLLWKALLAPTEDRPPHLGARKPFPVVPLTVTISGALRRLPGSHCPIPLATGLPCSPPQCLHDSQAVNWGSLPARCRIPPPSCPTGPACWKQRLSFPEAWP